ncbi:MAG: helix-turn-helix transcriptional regulator [Bacteroidetes bacterium]|nr:helix-turn-helix transcriptional regulator [Bacteroidota bacterium]
MSQNLGAEIKKILKYRGMTVSEFARRINKSRENIYSIFKRKSLDTELLRNISQVLEHDFMNKNSGRKKETSIFEESRPAYTRIEKEIHFLREEMLHMRKEIQFLRERMNVVERPKKKSGYRK